MGMTLSIPSDQLRFVPKAGIALAQTSDRKLVLHVEPIDSAPLWLVLTQDASDWLRTQLQEFDS